MSSLSISRRRFLQVTSATAAGAAVVGLERTSHAAPTPSSAAGDTQVATFCEMCFWRCSGFAHVRDGKVRTFVGNPTDPQSRGRLCPRGTGAPSSITDPDRLQTPLLRVGERGKEQWKSVTWGEALAFIAQKMQKIKAEHGAESIATFNHGIGARFLIHVLKSYGCINFAGPSFAQCRGPRDIGFLLTFGTGLGSPEPTDIENTNCLVLLGTHLGENMHNTQVQEFTTAVGRRVPVIVVDPRHSVAASKAKYWLPIKPGTDLALVLAWINVVVSEGRYDRAFVERYGQGFDKFATEVAKYTPEWAAAETGIDAQMIRVTAREFSSHRPATIIHPGRRVNWYGDDTQRSRAIALLNALMGNWGRKGGFFLAQGFSLPAYPLPKPPKSNKPMADNPDGERYPFADEAVTTGLRETTLTGKPYPIKGWFVYSTNIMNALPNEAETIKAIQNLDLMVVIDTVPSEIAGYADVILPETVFLERYDELLAGYGRRGWLALRQPVVKPPGEQKPMWWIAKELAAQLGIPECMPFKDMREYLAWRVEKGGYSFAKLEKEGVFLADKKPITVDEGLELSFDTPSGKIEFWSEQLAKRGYDPVPKYTKPLEAPTGYFRLVTGRSPVHTFSRTQSNPLLTSLMRENELWVNTATATKLAVRNGSYVRLKNQDGVVSNPIRVKATQRIRPDTLYMVYGFGQRNTMARFGSGRGASAAQLNTRYATDPLMGGTSLHANFVTLVKEA